MIRKLDNKLLNSRNPPHCIKIGNSISHICGRGCNETECEPIFLQSEDRRHNGTPDLLSSSARGVIRLENYLPSIRYPSIFIVKMKIHCQNEFSILFWEVTMMICKTWRYLIDEGSIEQINE